MTRLGNLTVAPLTRYYAALADIDRNGMHGHCYFIYALRYKMLACAMSTLSFPPFPSFFLSRPQAEPAHTLIST